MKRGSSTSNEKAIEIAVFVDDTLYRHVKENLEEKDPSSHQIIDEIQKIVFTYLNSVQLLYESEKLSTRFKLLLVRLDISKSPIRDLSKTRNIEKYLDNFCKWQKGVNPGHWRKGDLEDPGHWDHGLLLTGLDLYDDTPEYDSVIGLAWVSGMCHPSFSCTINEGNNFESVYVIAHEMGHNLGMNHDGEVSVGNTCDPDKYLMSPILGPGKVTWSHCSDHEIQDFLSGRTTANQAACLDDIPVLMEKYNYARDNLAPGEIFTAQEQCQQAFGNDFIPHRKDEPPFDNVCRELWCSNRTHALRAHPALEGTDCYHKPFPYGSICHSGECVPFDPNEEEPGKRNIVKNDNELEGRHPDGRPVWYDPIFTSIFETLRMKYGERYTTTLENNERSSLFSIKASDKLLESDLKVIDKNSVSKDVIEDFNDWAGDS